MELSENEWTGQRFSRRVVPVETRPGASSASWMCPDGCRVRCRARCRAWVCECSDQAASRRPRVDV
jgi:hypothetical protein